MRRFLVVAAGACLVSLAACGGGGDDGGAGGASEFNSSPVVYTGNSGPAVITATNAGALAATLFGNGSVLSSGLSVAPASPDAGLSETARRLTRAVRAGTKPSGQGNGRFNLAIPIDEASPCDSGFTRLKGTLNDNGTGALNVTYDNCRQGSDTLQGVATMQIDGFDGLQITSFLLTFARLQLRGPSLSIDLGGSFRSHLFMPTSSETITQNVVALDNLTGRMTRSENVVLVDRYDSLGFPTSYLETVTGRMYDSMHGYVDITTLAQLSFGSLTQEFPDSGMVQLAGAAGARIRATALSSDIVTLALDLDNNGSFEIAATLRWTEVGGPSGANLADTDGDGMHDSWETVRGLDPANPADAALDSDGDGASNLNEYLAGSDPANGGSTPPAVGLSIAAGDGPDPIALGSGTITYTLTVTNASSSPAINVVVTDTIPATANVFTAGATQGSCTDNKPVVCALGTINGFGAVTVTIRVIPTAGGVLTNSATVTSNSFDPDISDNTASSTTTVGFGVLGLQNMINAAPDGGAVNVVPALYIGSLDFNGKNVVLQSTAGPETTILHGNSGLALRMGPGGTVRGFTITGSPGLAVEVFGSGSVVEGNIFTGNGRVVEGNNASPVIRQNIFRNNGCGNAPNAGLIMPFNNSSPVIINNVFENNACFAVYLVLPSGNAPQVINNTFVGNFGAVKVDRRVTQVTQIYRNNILAQNGTGLHIDVAQGTTDAENPAWENNLVFGNTTADYFGTAGQTGSSGNISANPLFVNLAGGDYRLQTGSPAIDAASATGAPATDFDGTARPQGAGFDIGAFERIP